jgi:crotonobetainyl-CoA:carnitine CoA-transferase CaiB-like acyl-CoA transferase
MKQREVEIMAKPLEGIRILELANFIAGPFAGTLLADMGADVIKVEPPKGDMARATPPKRNGESVSFMALNRNKRSIVLDLKQPQAREALLKLAATSDALIEAYRPGALERMGLGAEAMKKANPKIVYAAVSGFGQTGPYRRRAGVNLIAEAFSGMLSVNGYPGQKPLRPGVQSADVFGALFTTYSVLCGLVGAARLGEGRIADISLVESAIAASAWEAAEYLETGKVPQPMGDKHRLTAPYQLFETADKRYIAIGAPNDGLFQQMMVALGLPEAGADARFQAYAARKVNEDALLAIVEPKVRTMTCAEVEARLMEVGVPCARANNFQEVFDDPHMVSRQMVHDVDHPKLGRLRVARNPVLLDHGGPGTPQPAPVLGHHSAEILASLGYSQAAIAEMVNSGATALGGV